MLRRGLKPRQRQFYKGQVQIPCCASCKNALRQFGSAPGSFSAQLPDHDVEFRMTGERLEAGVGAEAAVQFKGGRAALRQATGKLATGNQGKKLLGGPQGYCRSAGTRALQADFAQVQLL